MTDFKFDIDGKKLSSKEINAKRDFDKFHQGFKAQQKSYYQKGWFWGSAGFATLTILVALVFWMNSEEAHINGNSNYEKGKSVIQKPFENLDIDWETFVVNPQTGGTISTQSGGEITIPALAFQTKEGAVVNTGAVTIKYREFRDVVDQIISGIPMNYDSAGTQYMFESAGMFEIRGFIGDSAVEIQPEKEIAVKMKSNYPEDKYSFYCLDEKKGNWKYLGKDSMANLSAAHQRHSEEAIANIEAQYPLPNKALLKPSKATLDAVLQKVPEYQKINKRKVQIQSELEKLSKSKPTVPRKPNPDSEQFSLDIIEDDNPELVPYKDVLFELAKGQQIKPEDINENWNSAKLKRIDSTTVEVTFSKKNVNKHAKYLAHPVLQGEAFNKAQTQYLAHMDSIQSKKQELESLNFNLAALRQKVEEGIINEKYVQEEMARLEKIALEKLNRQKKLKDLYESEFNNTSTVKNVNRFFKIQEFGVFNSDHATKNPIVQSNPIQKIDFNGNKEIVPVLAVFKAQNGNFGSDAVLNNDFTLYENCTVEISIVNGKLGVLKRDTALLQNGIVQFDVKGKPESREQLEGWLGF